MRNFILNKSWSVPLIFSLLLCSRGGDIAAYVMDGTNLSDWLEANKLGITFSGADFSMLPAVIVIGVVISISFLIHYFITVVVEMIDLFAEAPKPTSNVAAPLGEIASANTPDSNSASESQQLPEHNRHQGN